jgi:hypothetical protein
MGSSPGHFHMWVSQSRWCSLMTQSCRAQFTYFFCDTDCSQFTLCMYHFSITLVSTIVLVLLATLLLTLFSSVPLWWGLVYIMPLWHHSAEGWVCAWPSSSVLLPTRNWLSASCIPHILHLNYVTDVKTWCRQTLWQAWYLSPSHLQSTKPPVSFTFSCAFYSWPGCTVLYQSALQLLFTLISIIGGIHLVEGEILYTWSKWLPLLIKKMIY